MQLFIETVIYLLAILGIILVSSSFYEAMRYSNILKNKYNRIFNKGDKKVEVIIRLYNVSEGEKIEVINKIKTGDYKDIEEEIDLLNIEEIFDNPLK